MIAELQAQGVTSLSAIARALTEHRIPRPREGTNWSAKQVTRTVARQQQLQLNIRLDVYQCFCCREQVTCKKSRGCDPVKRRTEAEITLCDDDTRPLERQADADAFCVVCLGGFRAAKSKKDVWVVGPIIEGGSPCLKGFFTQAELNAFTHKSKLHAIAFQSMGWNRGAYHSHWTPIVTGRKNHLQGPADLWSNITANLTRQRSVDQLRDMKDPIREKIAEILDGR